MEIGELTQGWSQILVDLLKVTEIRASTGSETQTFAAASSLLGIGQFNPNALE